MLWVRPVWLPELTDRRQPASQEDGEGARTALMCRGRLGVELAAYGAVAQGTEPPPRASLPPKLLSLRPAATQRLLLSRTIFGQIQKTLASWLLPEQVHFGLIH